MKRAIRNWKKTCVSKTRITGLKLLFVFLLYCFYFVMICREKGQSINLTVTLNIIKRDLVSKLNNRFQRSPLVHRWLQVWRGQVFNGRHRTSLKDTVPNQNLIPHIKCTKQKAKNENTWEIKSELPIPVLS